MSAALSPSAASALFSVLRCVCCATPLVGVELAVADVESEVAVAFGAEEVSAKLAELPTPAAVSASAAPLAVALRIGATAVELFVFVADCAEAVAETATPLGKADVFGALNNPAACA